MITQKIYENGRKLFVITIKAGTRPPMEFLLDMMMDHGMNDVHLPFPVGMKDPVSAKFVKDFNDDFRPAQLRTYAPSFQFARFEQYAPLKSSVPFLMVGSPKVSTSGTVFDALFHPSHLIQGPPQNRPYIVKVFATKLEADVRNGAVVPWFSFWCEQIYYCVL